MSWQIWNDTEQLATLLSEQEARDFLKLQGDNSDCYAENSKTGELIEIYDDQLFKGDSNYNSGKGPQR